MSSSPLIKGKPVELLTNYKSVYEEVRERKGYGRRNTKSGMKSDDCISTRLQRNFSEREDVQNIIEGTKSVMRLSWLIQAMDHDIFRPLIEMLRTRTKLSPLQWVAIRRVHWLVNVFREKIRQDSKTARDKSLWKFYEPKLNFYLNDMDMIYYETFPPYIKHNQTSHKKEIQDAVDIELIEEICFDLRVCLPQVLDASVYCPIAIRLTKSLCNAIAKLRLFRESDDDEDSVRQKLLDKVFDCALQAQKEIFASVQQPEGGYISLQFTSGLNKDYNLAGNVDENMAVALAYDVFSLRSTTTPKGITAAIVEKLDDNNKHLVEIGNQFVMINSEKFIDVANFKALGSVPFDVCKGERTDQINTTWYILTQVVLIVHGFAKIYLKGSSYSIVTLCNKLHVNIAHAEFIVQLGMKEDHGKCFKRFLQERLRSKPEREGRSEDSTYHQSRGNEGNKTRICGTACPRAELVYEGPPTTKFPSHGDWPNGWIQRSYSRSSGETKGKIDHYWFPPGGKSKLRSSVEILRYLVQTMPPPT
jgi:hypothetical protein